MLRSLAAAVVLVAGCKSGDGTSPEPASPPPATNTAGSGGFSASLSSDLDLGGGTGVASAGSGSAAPSAGSGSAAGVGSGSAAPSAGSGTAAPSPPPKVDVAAGSAAPAAGSAAPVAPTTAPRGPVEVPPELAAIKLSLQPNWDRDQGEAGTISLAVKVQRTDESALFKFHYGYDDPRAPTDREAYKKFLTSSKILTVAADRQRGAAWMLEGDDASGHPAFRILVTYGGKRLVCYGSLYKDSSLGDIRDEVILQAKKICETIQL